jgi:hypothetical protein
VVEMLKTLNYYFNSFEKDGGFSERLYQIPKEKRV